MAWAEVLEWGVKSCYFESFIAAAEEKHHSFRTFKNRLEQLAKSI